MRLAQSLLREGQNQVRLIAQVSQTDVSLVDVIRLTYRHTYQADDDALRLTLSGGQQVTIAGFAGSEIRVIDITDPDAAVELAGEIRPRKDGYGVTITAPADGQRNLYACARKQAKQPAAIAANQPSAWRQPGNGANLLIITHRQLSPSLEPLVAHRQSQGLSVALIDTEDLFDEFSFGEKTPYAIRDFLAYAAQHWKKAPRAVLLAGEASYDAKNYLGFGDFDLVPTKLIDTQFMETASDDWFADFDSDGLAEMAVGRLPARTAAEAARMVAKIISYDDTAGAEEVLLVADSNEGFDFEATSEQLRALIPDALRVTSLQRGRIDAAAAREVLLDAINRGQKIVNYTGHGSVDQWRGNLLTAADASKLTNEKNPLLFVLMTCLNGYFDDPALDSLAASLLKAEGGAVAVWASSAMCLPDDQAALNREFYRQLFGGGSVTIGEAARRAKQSITDADVRRTWILLGDPLTKLR